jgi:hypothetical protein
MIRLNRELCGKIFGYLIIFRVTPGIFLTFFKEVNNMILTISDEEIQQIKAALLDEEGEEALRLLKEFMKRLDQQNRSGMKSHLG